MIKCLIVDDEPLAVKLLSSYVEKVDQLELAASFTNPLEALSHLSANKDVDLVFLDIQMPELNGIQIAKVLDQNVKVIFTTAYPDYAVDGFELKALDYLLKPISFHRFIDAVNRIEQSDKVKAPIATTIPDYLFVKTEHRLQKVDMDKILFFKGMGDYCAIVTDEGKIMTLENMKSFESKLPKSKFIRIHKSYIISISKIEYIEKGRIRIKDELLPISASYEKTFKQKLANL